MGASEVKHYIVTLGFDASDEWDDDQVPGYLEELLDRMLPPSIPDLMLASVSVANVTEWFELHEDD